MDISSNNNCCLLIFKFLLEYSGFIVCVSFRCTTKWISYIYIHTHTHTHTHIYVKVKVTQSCPTLCDSMDCTVRSWNSPGQNTEVGSLFLLQGIFPTQRSNPGLPHCRQILYQLSHQGSPRILKWVACAFSSRSSWPKNWIRISYIAGRFFTNWAIREAHIYVSTLF